MNSKVKAIIGATLALLVGFASYKRGVSDATRKAAAYDASEYGNDMNGDQTVHHSVSYNLGYARGKGTGVCRNKAARFLGVQPKVGQVAVESGNPRIGGNPEKSVLAQT